jgi:hypothetical protein
MPYAGANRENPTRVRVIRALVEAGPGHRIVIAQGVCRETQLTRDGGEGYGHGLRRVPPLMTARGQLLTPNA